MSDSSSVPVLKWGILGTGWISTMFVTDALAQRPDAKAKHIIAAIGSSSSAAKGNEFVDKNWKNSVEPRPQVFGNYEAIYNHEEVDIVYVGTAHALHKENCLAAINAGKHVLCEKPFAINESEAREVVQAAKAKGVFIMEAVWTRFFPFFQSLQQQLYVMKSIGNVQRVFIDFGAKMPISTLPDTSRLKNPALGAGALLDIGIYSLTYASLILGEWKLGADHPQPEVISTLGLHNGMDETDVVILKYPPTRSGEPAGGKLAICTSTVHYKTAKDFGRIEGTEGTITLFGRSASLPSGFRVKSGTNDPLATSEAEEEVFTFPPPDGTFGFFYEADAVAVDIANGKTESSVMPLDETLRMMRLMDGIRQNGGLKYAQDRV